MKIAPWLLLVAALVAPASVPAQQWPSKTVRIIAANSAGGAPDLAARVFNESLAKVIGRPVVLENRPGADGYIAADAVIRSEPDGHTLFFATQSLFAIDPFVKKTMPFDPMRAFTPLAVVFDDTGPTGLFTGMDSPYRTWPELVAYAKQNPGKVDYATTVPLFRMLGTWLARRGGFEWHEIPYKGGNLANQDVIAGRVGVVINAFGPLEQSVRSGKLRVLAVVKPVQGWPQIPQVADFYPGFSQPAFVVLAAAAGMQPALAQRINRAAASVVEDPAFNHEMASVRWANWEGARTVEGTQEFIRTRREAWQKFIREAGIQRE
jgi:tripartite-type tricarboxylate transporter receptor subunit TctC